MAWPVGEGLSDLDIAGTILLPGLEVVGNAGLVRVTGCTIDAGFPAFDGDGPIGVDVQDNAGVLIVDCVVRGGHGWGDSVSTSLGKSGGAGLRTRTTPTAVYDCSVDGGTGGAADFNVGQTGGPGGPGCHVESFGAFFANTRVTGGHGGSGWKGGPGGDALRVDAGAQAQLLACLLVKGLGGDGTAGGDGALGGTTSGSGTFNFLPGAAREFGASTLGAEQGSLQVTVEGEPGDQVWVRASSKPAHVPALALGGLWSIGRPNKLPSEPMAVIGAGGTAQVSVGLPDVGPGQGARELYLQG